ncbi:hypothetical protein AVEN_129249-1 [Araneus ventricosus]|uniref:Uncharacterized protein n=1 Tax=Araneus ventricosus TaxID=182803 RepID=A0A4Y2RBD7_ARAVE|nr:hypothetical protein AVEN_129249-1 [Araneus ventricosus]
MTANASSLEKCGFARTVFRCWNRWSPENGPGSTVKIRIISSRWGTAYNPDHAPGNYHLSVPAPEKLPGEVAFLQ